MRLGDTSRGTIGPDRALVSIKLTSVFRGAITAVGLLQLAVSAGAQQQNPLFATAGATVTIEAYGGGVPIGGGNTQACGGAGCSVTATSSYPPVYRFNGQGSVSMSVLNISVSGSFDVQAAGYTLNAGGDTSAGGSQKIYVNVPPGTQLKIHVTGGTTFTASDSQSSASASILTSAGRWSGTVDQTYTATVQAQSITDQGITYYYVDTLSVSGQATGGDLDNLAHSQSFSANGTWMIVPTGAAGKLLQYVAGDGQNHFAGHALKMPLSVVVIDVASGQPIPNEPIQFGPVVAPPGATSQRISPTSTFTGGSNGYASASMTLGEVPGVYSAPAVCPGCSAGSPYTFTETALSASAGNPNAPGAPNGTPLPNTQNNAGGPPGSPSQPTQGNASVTFVPSAITALAYGKATDVCAVVVPAGDAGTMKFTNPEGDLTLTYPVPFTNCTSAGQVGIHVRAHTRACLPVGTIVATPAGSQQPSGSLTANIDIPAAEHAVRQTTAAQVHDCATLQIKPQCAAYGFNIYATRTSPTQSPDLSTLTMREIISDRRPLLGGFCATDPGASTQFFPIQYSAQDSLYGVGDINGYANAPTALNNCGALVTQRLAVIDAVNDGLNASGCGFTVEPIRRELSAVPALPLGIPQWGTLTVTRSDEH
jgi:hypothetical protein